MTSSSLFGLEDMEALLWAGPSSPMADPPAFRPDKQLEGPPTGGGGAPASPLPSSSLSSSSSPPFFYSPPASPPLLLEEKAGPDLLSFPWLDDQLRCGQTLADDAREEMLSGLDWMAERMDLSQLDLDSLIGSCTPPEEGPASPEDLLASLDCPMELESFPLPILPAPPTFEALPAPPEPPVVDGQEVPSSPLFVPEPQEELEIKSEPASPDPASPAFTLDLGSEVDVSETEEKPAPPTVDPPAVPQLPRILLSIPTTRIVLLLAPKNEVGLGAAPEVARHSPPRRPPRSRPYPAPDTPSAPQLAVHTPRGGAGPEGVARKTPKDKRHKKMEQNKTAATRYRQKKRAEHDALAEEHAHLERKNVELTEKAESMAREIQYLKELMEEVHLARLKKGLSPAAP